MSRPKTRYVASLDGLRAFAVIAVVAYHLNAPFAVGGLLGVTMFFVLSGYLITTLLIAEVEATGTIDLKDFWVRRVKRIVPAVVFTIIGTAALCALFNHALLTKLRPDALPTLLFFNNWWQILHNVSYFDALGAPSPLAHTWSLAIEEQFYLIWPLLLFFLVKRGVRKSSMAKGCAIAALVSAVLMALLFSPEADPSRVYYGTDTRAFSLLIGVMLAFAWPYPKLDERAHQALDGIGRLALDGVGAASLAGLVLLVMFADGFSPFLYRGGLLLCSVLTALLMACIVHPQSMLGRLLGAAPLTWLGKRSYSLYLWHYPLLLLTTPGNTADGVAWWLAPLQVALMVGMAHVSYAYVENPLRRMTLSDVRAVVGEGVAGVRTWARAHLPYTVGGTLTLAIAVGGLTLVPDTNALEGADLLKQAEEAGGVQAGAELEGTGGEERADGDPDADREPGFYRAEAREGVYDILMLGDSVSVRAVPAFRKAFPHGMLDAAVNRQFYGVNSFYEPYRQAGTVGSIVVVALGTNGYVTNENIDAFMESVGPGRMVWFVNTRSRTDWQANVNATLAAAVQRYPNAALIDWYGASAAHGDWFDGDGTHLSEAGAHAYVDLVRQSVADFLPERPEPTPEPEAKEEAEGGAQEGSAANDQPTESAQDDAPAETSESAPAAQAA
ncbi:acetyltransferase [Eggerthellaceae bacterium zg-1084]|uniref:acyltransferase family protein n=1 Tax=Berryella wangjianweii TaxID=2734634 RepID=UPI00155537A4|nr:acyltransferase family protein [Berryella wangjianweii]NPD30836.1 acetyltransferase [Berryella wangjianweii]NPD31703.1 acetyltransferase [Eggerthellaceae bacterium zg-997]